MTVGAGDRKPGRSRAQGGGLGLGLARGLWSRVSQSPAAAPTDQSQPEARRARGCPAAGLHSEADLKCPPLSLSPLKKKKLLVAIEIQLCFLGLILGWQTGLSPRVTLLPGGQLQRLCAQRTRVHGGNLLAPPSRPEELPPSPGQGAAWPLGFRRRCPLQPAGVRWCSRKGRRPAGGFQGDPRIPGGRADLWRQLMAGGLPALLREEKEVVGGGGSSSLGREPGGVPAGGCAPSLLPAKFTKQQHVQGGH